MTAAPVLTIVTYHYIRPIAGSAWPGIKGLEVERFRGQLDYIQRHYTPVGAELLFAEARGEKPEWPARPLLLTFDDGYFDHYHHAFKEMRRRGLKGAFFAPTQSLLDRRLLDVNKVHFVLAAESDHRKLASEIDAHLASMLPGDSTAAIAGLHAAMRKPSRWDPAETVYVKRVLQRGPSADVRSAIAGALFRKYVSADIPAFAEQLYLTPAQAREMISEGMHFGSHGDQHIWFDHSSVDEQRQDLENSLRLRTTLGLKDGEYSICYPYGGYSAPSLDLARQYGFTLGFTTRLDLNAVSRDTKFLELARIDAGADVPSGADAPVSSWTKRVLC
ncbi:MAG: polysaccharide deacetylase family protein [Rhizobiales bacterium]|nr:polysaccharide deacetylase family protein [Hyphomicrobiales bacterium]